MYPCLNIEMAILKYVGTKAWSKCNCTLGLYGKNGFETDFRPPKISQSSCKHGKHKGRPRKNPKLL